MDSWINVNDRLPEKNTRVLIYDDIFEEINICDYCKKETISGKTWEQKGFWFNENDGEYRTEMDVTHWQPLPKTPIVIIPSV